MSFAALAGAGLGAEPGEAQGDRVDRRAEVEADRLAAAAGWSMVLASPTAATPILCPSTLDPRRLPSASKP